MYRKNEYTDIEKYKRTKRAYQNRYYGRTANAPNSRQTWTQSECERVLAHDVSDRVLSSEIGRSVKAIQIQRGRLRKSVGSEGIV